MKINGVDGGNAAVGLPGMNQADDAVSRSLQKQIADAQKQLQELSANGELSLEQKMEKRQEIQKKISELNNQLRQHQMELKKEKQKEAGSSMEDMLGAGNQKKASKNAGPEAGLSQANAKAMISADAAMEQARVQGSVASQMEGRAGVLKVEIKQDAALGGNTEAKEKELAEAEKIAVEATASQISTLGKAQEEMKEAAAESGESEETETADAKQAGVKAVDEEKTVSEADGADRNGKATSAGGGDEAVTGEEQTSGSFGYVPVDVRV